MGSFYKLIELSKKIAASLLKEKEPTDLLDSDFFEDQDKKYIYEHITDKKLIKERNELSNKIDVEEDWKIIKSKIEIPVKKNNYRWYAAASIVLGFFFSFYVFSDKASTEPAIVEKESIKKNNIAVGANKAVLTLEDGSNINLEKGKTFKTNAINSNGEQLVYNKTNQEKTSYNYLTIPRGGQYFVKLSDGTEVWLNSESKLKFPVAFIADKTREVELIYGEAYFAVSPSTKHNGAKFKVINKGQDIEVLGTEFNLKAYKDETNIYTTLVEGKVVVSNAVNNSTHNLLPNQQSILNIESNKMKVSSIDVKSEISWKDGLFSFKEKNLKDIMKVISRWYDVDVVFQNKSLETIKFKGVLGKEQNIEDILSSIKTLSVINDYKVDGKTIILN